MSLCVTVVKSDFPYHKELLLKERIRSLCEQILSCKRNFPFEKVCNWRESLLDPVVYPFIVLATPLLYINSFIV